MILLKLCIAFPESILIISMSRRVLASIMTFFLLSIYSVCFFNATISYNLDLALTFIPLVINSLVSCSNLAYLAIFLSMLLSRSFIVLLSRCISFSISSFNFFSLILYSSSLSTSFLGSSFLPPNNFFIISVIILL